MALSHSLLGGLGKLTAARPIPASRSDEAVTAENEAVTEASGWTESCLAYQGCALPWLHSSSAGPHPIITGRDKEQESRVAWTIMMNLFLKFLLGLI